MYVILELENFVRLRYSHPRHRVQLLPTHLQGRALHRLHRLLLLPLARNLEHQVQPLPVALISMMPRSVGIPVQQGLPCLAHRASPPIKLPSTMPAQADGPCLAQRVPPPIKQLLCIHVTRGKP